MKTKAKGVRAAAAALLAVFGIVLFLPLFAGVSAAEAEAHYCDDGYYDEGYGGEGQSANASYTIEYDYYVEHREYYVSAAPSYSSVTAEQTNNCASKAGANIIGYYDRYYPELIPDFEPGYLYPNNAYLYFPRVFQEQSDLITALYYMMNTNVTAPGATEQDFKDGLTEYVEDHGYDIGFSSFHNNSTSVNYTAVQQMVQQKKVGVLLCDKYNFIFSINHDPDGTNTYISKRDYNISHMMMVYGYLIIDYYKDGSCIASETYLQVSSGFADGSQGYIKMNDYLTIDNALVVSIS